MNSKISGVIAALALSSAVWSQTPMPGFAPDVTYANATDIIVFRLSSNEVPSSVHPDGTRAPWTIAGTVEHTILTEAVGLPMELSIEVTTLLRPFDGLARGKQLNGLYEPLEEGDTLLAFLVRDGSGSLRLAQENYGLLRVSTRRANGRHPTPRDETLAELRAALADPEPGVVTGAMTALAGFVDIAALPQARRLSTSDDLSVAFAALRLRLILKDGSALKPTAELVESELGGVQGWTQGHRDQLAWSLARAGESLDVRALERLLVEAHYPTLRSAVAEILSRTGDRASMPALIAGLSHPELETQYRCVVGLCRITNTRGPGREEFFRDPAPTVSSWQTRWQRRR